MNKSDLIAAAAEAAQISEKDAALAVEAVFSAIARGLRQGQRIHIVGFGTFETRQRQAHTGSNPKTGGQMEIAAAQIPVFRAAKGLKDRINERSETACG